jgi:hypothetical protein
MQKSEFERFFLGWASLPLIVLIPSCLIGLAYLRRLPVPLVILTIYLWFSLFIEISARFAAAWYRQNIPLFHLYTLGEFCLFAFFYKQILERVSFFRQNFFGITSVIVLVIIGNTAYNGLFAFNANAKMLTQFTLVLLALEFAFTFTEEDFPATRLRQSIRLINTSILLYYVGSLYYFWFYRFAGKVPKGNTIKALLLNANAGLNFIFHLLILIALCRIIYKPRK